MIRIARLELAILVAFAIACSTQGKTDAAAGGANDPGGAPATAGASSGGSSGGQAGSAGNGAAGSGAAGAGGSAGSGHAGAGGSSGAAGSQSSGGAGAAGSAGASTGGASAGGAGAAGAAGTAGTAGAAGDTVDAKQMAVDMGFGTNIGNTLDNTTAWETGWGQPLISQAYIDGMASRGIKTVRVPVAWDTYAVNGVIDSSKMDRVKQVVSWIEAAGMYAIVNIHWDGGWIDNDTTNNPNRYLLSSDVKAKFASYWTQIATAFSGVGHKLILEGLNEESQFYVGGDKSKPDYAALGELNQLFVTTVRAQAGFNKTRALLIAGFTTDVTLTCVSAFTIPNDPAGAGKLFLSIHYYTPFTFAQLDDVASWGSPRTTWGTAADKAELAGLFDTMGSFSTQREIPIVLGEFAVTPGQKYPRDPASRVLWLESIARASFARGIVPVLWDTGSEISRSDGSFSTTLQTVMSDLKQ